MDNPTRAPNQKSYHYWTREELDLLSDAWAIGGLKAAREALPGRSDDSLRGKAHSLGVTIASRKRHERYEPSEFVDAAIKKAYRNAMPDLNTLSAQIGRPKGWIKYRAGVLGVRRIMAGGGIVWLEDEDAILNECIELGLSINTMHKRLRSAGFNRSLSAISARMSRLELRVNRQWWTASDVAKLLGVDEHLVVRHINAGLLKAERQGGNRRLSDTPSEAKMWAITQDNLRRFMLEHPGRWDHRRMQKEALLDLLCQGQFNQSARGAVAG